VPAAAKVHESVALPEPVTLVGLAKHAVLSAPKPTMPVKPFSGVTVRVDVPALPAFTVTVVGMTLSEKSWTMNVTVAECDKPPLVPVAVTWTVEADTKEHDRVELPEPGKLAGDAVQEVLLVARLTIPAKPFGPDTLMVEVTVDPALPVTPTGLAVMVKS